MGTQDVAEAARRLAAEHDLVLVEGAGGPLVRFDDTGATLADAARLLGAPVLVVASAGLGTLNATALTVEALRARGLMCPGVLVGSWPAEPDLAMRCNLADLPDAAGAPLLGAVPHGVGTLAPADFRARAADWTRTPSPPGIAPARSYAHLTTKKDTRVGDWAVANNVEFAYTPTNSSWLNRIEAQFTALRYFALDGTDHASHKEQGSMIRRYIIWRNKHAADERLREVVNRANVA